MNVPRRLHAPQIRCHKDSKYQHNDLAGLFIRFLVYSIFVKNGCKERQIMLGQVIACNEKLSIPV